MSEKNEFPCVLSKEYWNHWLGKLFSLAVSVKMISIFLIFGVSTKMLMMKLLESSDYAKIVLGVISIVVVREAIKVDVIGKIKDTISAIKSKGDE